jgi:GT2 family glycosyltransferase
VEEAEKIALAAYRFAYAYVHRWNIPFPLVHMPDVHNGVLTAKTLEDFKPGVHQCLDYCTDILLGERSVIPVSTGREKSCDSAEEIEALRRGLTAITGKAPPAAGLRLSVVITCYNYGKYLRECVRSVARQTFRDFELIIVNDGSTDDSLDVARACAVEFAALGIRLVDQPNSGQPALARNAGIRQAKGEFILPIDADDQIDPTYLEHAFALIDADRSVDLVYADALIDNGKTRTRRKAGRFDIASLTAANPIVYCSIYRRELWEKVGGYRDNVRGYEDWDFWIALGLAGARAVHADCIGLVYNEKTSGVYSETVAHHQARVARIVLNNPTGYTAAQRQNAQALLGVSTPPQAQAAAHSNQSVPAMTTPVEFARIVMEAEALVREGRLDEAISKIEATLPFAPNGECTARAQEILELLRAARPADDEFFGADEVENIQQLIAAYRRDPADPSREQLVALQQGLMNFLDTADLLALERQFAGTFGEVFRAMAASGLPAEAASAESAARLVLLDQSLADGAHFNGAFNFRPLLARMLCAPASRGTLAVKPEQLPLWLRHDFSTYCSSAESSDGVASAKELCASSGG